MRGHVLVRGTNVLVGVRSVSLGGVVGPDRPERDADAMSPPPRDDAVEAGRFAVALAHVLAESGTTPRRLDVELVERASAARALPAALELRIFGDVPGVDEAGLAAKAAEVLANAAAHRFARLDARMNVVASLLPVAGAGVDRAVPKEPPSSAVVESRGRAPHSPPALSVPQRPPVLPDGVPVPPLQRARGLFKPLLIAGLVGVIVIGVVGLIVPRESPGVAGVQVVPRRGEATLTATVQPAPAATRAATSAPTASATGAATSAPTSSATRAAATSAPTSSATSAPLAVPAAAPTAAATQPIASVLPTVAATSSPTELPLPVGSTVPVAASASPTVRAAGAPRPPTLDFIAGQTSLPRWPNDTASTAWFAQDGYHLSVNRTGQFVAISVVPEALGNVRVTATFRKTGGPTGGGYGIIVRDQGPGPRDGLNQRGSYYVLEVGDRGEVGMWRRDQGTWVDLVPWTPTGAVRPGLGENTVMVEALGERLSLSVNGTMVASTADNTLGSGSIGIFLGGDENEALLTRLTVEQLD